jgi:HEAT repeat protein
MLRFIFILCVFIIQYLFCGCATAQKAEVSAKPYTSPYISLEEDRGMVTISSEEKNILLQATNATLEEMLQGFADHQKMILKVYCNDPSLDKKKTTITLKSPTIREILTQILKPRYEISFLNQEGKPAEGDEPVKMADIYPEDCQKRDHPVRTFISLKEHPILNKPREEITLQELFQIFKEEGPSSRMGALHILGLKREKDGIPLVKEALFDNNADVMLGALKSLERFGKIYGAEEVSDAIFARIQETPYPEFLIALAKLDKEKVWSVVDKFINMRDSRGENVAVRALNLTKDRRAIPYLSKIALSDDMENSQQAIWGIGSIDGSEGADTLIKLLREGDENQKIFSAQAVNFLPENEKARAQEEVIKLVKKPDVSEEMLIALARVLYLEPFRSLLTDNNIKPSLKVKALSALVYARNEKAVDIAGACIDDKDTGVRIEAVNLMAEIATENTIPYLIHATEDSKPEVKKSALNALAGFNTENVISALSKALEDFDDGVRKAAIDTFYQMGEPNEEMVSILKNASAKNSDPYVSGKAAQILQLWGKDK